MIAYLKGFVQQLGDETIVLNVNGVGYETFCSEQTLSALVGEGTAELLIYTHVREDQISLYGFLSANEKQLFLSLIKVNGIGPRVAMKILGAAPIEEIIRRIDEGDVRGLSQLPKVGKKTAETIILELRGKLVQLEEEKRRQAFAARPDIVSALVNLGFRLSEVDKVVGEMDPKTGLEDGVRRGLQVLTGQ